VRIKNGYKPRFYHYTSTFCAVYIVPSGPHARGAVQHPANTAALIFPPLCRKLLKSRLFRLETEEWRELLSSKDSATKLDSGYFMVNDKRKYAVDPMELMGADISQVYGKISKDPQWMGLGHIAMTVVGGNLAESHCERCISAANLIMTDGKTLMGEDLLEQLCVLRMNRKYMAGAKLR